MNAEQFERWLDFAGRMARTAHRRNRRVEEYALSFIEDHRRYMAHVHGWDGDTCQECGWQRTVGDHMRPSDRPRPVYVCDDLSEFSWDFRLEREKRNGESYQTRTGSAVACCIRAGLDVALKPSAGVIGYTVGDLRAMYPEGFPRWLKKELGRKILKAPDDAAVWL